MNLMTTKPKERSSIAPQGAIHRFRDEMERMFDRFVAEPLDWAWPGRDGMEWMPPLDLIDGDKEVTLRMELPGVLPKDVDVSISGNLLTISGKKEEVQQQTGQNYFTSERRYGAFRRCIELPDGIDPEKINAEQDNGVLTVKIVRLKAATPKHIPIRPGKNG